MADAIHCRARGVGLSMASISADGCFYIAAANGKGIPLSRGGDDVELIFTSPCRVEGSIIDNGEGFYEVTYKPLPVGGEDNHETLWVTRLPVLRRRTGRLEYRHRDGAEANVWAADTFELKAGVLVGASSDLRINISGCNVCADDTREMEREGVSFKLNAMEFKAGSAVSKAQWLSVIGGARREHLFNSGLHKLGGSECSRGELQAVHTPVSCPSDQKRGLFLHICIKVNGREMDGSPWHFTLTPPPERDEPLSLQRSATCSATLQVQAPHPLLSLAPVQAAPPSDVLTPPPSHALLVPPGPPAAAPAPAATEGRDGASAGLHGPGTAAPEASTDDSLETCMKAACDDGAHDHDDNAEEASHVVLVPTPAANTSKAIAERCVEQQLSHILHFLYTHHDPHSGAPGGPSSCEGSMDVHLVSRLEAWLHAGPHDGPSLEHLVSGIGNTHASKGGGPVLGSLLCMLRHLRRLQDAVELGTAVAAPPSPAGSLLHAQGLKMLSVPRSAASRVSGTSTSLQDASSMPHMSSCLGPPSRESPKFSAPPAGHPLQHPRRLKTRPLDPRPEWQRPTAKDRPLAGPTSRAEVVRSLLQRPHSSTAPASRRDGTEVKTPGTAAGANRRRAWRTKAPGTPGEGEVPSKYGNIYSLLSHQAREHTADARATITAPSSPSYSETSHSLRGQPTARGKKNRVREVAVQTEGGGRQGCSQEEEEASRRHQLGPWSPASSDRSAFSRDFPTPGRYSGSRHGSRDAAGASRLPRRTPARERWRDAFEPPYPQDAASSTSVTPDRRPKAPCYVDLYSPSPGIDAEVATVAEEQRLCDWLAGLGMQHLAPIFIQQGLVRLSNLELLDEEDLQELGVRLEVDRRALLSAIHDFSQRTKRYTRHALRDGPRRRPMPLMDPRPAHQEDVKPTPPPVVAEEPACSPVTVSADAHALLRAFDERDDVRLLADFTRLLPPAAREAGHPLCSVTSTLEFYLYLYAAIGEIQDSKEQAGEALGRFRRYLLSRPSVAQSPSLCGFSSLPDIQDPLQHPTFAPLFDPQWAAALRERLRLYLHIVVVAPQVTHASPVEVLSALPSSVPIIQETTGQMLSPTSVASPSSSASCYGQPLARQRPSRRAPPVPTL